MTEMIYADRIGAIAIIDGVARIDLLALSPEDKTKASARKVATLAISLCGLVQVHEELAKLVDKLVSNGVLVKRQKVQSSADAPASS